MWMFSEKHFQRKNLINKKEFKDAWRDKREGQRKPKEKVFFNEIGNIWQYDTSQVTLNLKRQSRAHETDTSNHQTSQKKARIKFPQRQKGIFWTFAEEVVWVGVAAQPQLWMTLGWGTPLKEFFFTKQSAQKTPNSQRYSNLTATTFYLYPPHLFSTEMKYANKPTRDSLGLRILWNSSSSLVFFILVLNRGPEGGRAIQNTIFKVSSSSASSLPPAAPSSSSFSSTVATPDPPRTASPVVTKVAMHFANF